MKSRPFLIAILALAGLTLSSPSFAEDKDSISVKAEVDRAFITIGDPVQYSVTIRHAPDLQILSVISAPSQDILKIKKIEDLHRQERETIVEGKKFTLTAFRLGEFILDPIQIQYRSRKGGEIKNLQTERIYLTVKSVAAGETKTDIRGIKAVVSLPGSVKVILAFLLLLFLAGGGFLIYRFLKKPAVQIQGPEPRMTLEEEAFLLLNQLFDSDWIRRGKVKEYYLKLSEILRAYFEKRFQILAIESTTHEIVRSLKQKGIDRKLVELIAEVLEAADLAKFAKWVPEPSRILQLNQKARQIIEEARPQEVAHAV